MAGYTIKRTVNEYGDPIQAVIRDDGRVMATYQHWVPLKLGACRESRGSIRLVPCVIVYDAEHPGIERFRDLLE